MDGAVVAAEDCCSRCFHTDDREDFKYAVSFGFPSSRRTIWMTRPRCQQHRSTCLKSVGAFWRWSARRAIDAASEAFLCGAQHSRTDPTAVVSQIQIFIEPLHAEPHRRRSGGGFSISACLDYTPESQRDGGISPPQTTKHRGVTKRFSPGAGYLCGATTTRPMYASEAPHHCRGSLIIAMG